jgi:hypothetical protein
MFERIKNMLAGTAPAPRTPMAPPPGSIVIPVTEHSEHPAGPGGHLRRGETSSAAWDEVERRPAPQPSVNDTVAKDIYHGIAGRVRAIMERLGYEGTTLIGVKTWRTQIIQPSHPGHVPSQTFESQMLERLAFDGAKLDREVKAQGKWNDPELLRELRAIREKLAAPKATFAQMERNGHTGEHYEELLKIDEAAAGTAAFKNLRADRAALHGLVAGEIRVLRARLKQENLEVIPHVANIGRWLQTILEAALDAQIEKELRFAHDAEIPFQPSILIAALQDAVDTIPTEIANLAHDSVIGEQFWGFISRRLAELKS